MSLNKEAQKKLLKAMKFSDAEITKLVDDAAEVDVTVPPTVQIFTAEELTTRDGNITTTAKADGVREGEKQGKELAAKAFKKKFNITDETKDIDKVAELTQTQLSKGDDGLKEQIKLLQGQVTEKETAIEQAKKIADAAIFDAQLISHLPQNRKAAKDGGFSDNEYLSVIKNGLTFERTESGAVVVKKGGEILRDTKTTNPLALPDVLSNYFEERQWTAKAAGGGGRGGGDNGGGGATGLKTMSAVQEKWQKDNPNGNVISPEFNAHVAQVMKDTPDFKPYE